MNRSSKMILKIFLGVLLTFQGVFKAEAYPIYAKLSEQKISRMVNKQPKQVFFHPPSFFFSKNQKKEAFDFALGNTLGDAYIHLSKGQMCFDQAVKE